MKIVHIMISCFYIEGAGYQENLLSKAHKRDGHDVTIISSQYCFNSKYEPLTRPAGEYINDDGIKVIILPDNKRLPSILGTYQRKCKGLYATLDNVKPDIIFMHGLTEKDGYDAAKYVSRHSNVILYCDHHQDYYNSAHLNKGLLSKLHFNLLIKPIAQYIANYCRMFWGTTPWRVQHLIEVYGIPKEKADFLVMGADDTKIHWSDKSELRLAIRAKYNIGRDDFLIVTGGKINKEKNIHILANAVSSNNLPNVKLLIFGQPDDATKPLLDCYNNNENIIQIGWIDSDKVYDIFLSADLGYFPGTHSVLWEQAVACGLPTVFKLWDGMKHVNVNGNSILQEVITVDTISALLSDLVGNTKRMEDMRNAAMNAKNMFCYSEIAKKAIGVENPK